MNYPHQYIILASRKNCLLLLILTFSFQTFAQSTASNLDKADTFLYKFYATGYSQSIDSLFSYLDSTLYYLEKEQNEPKEILMAEYWNGKGDLYGNLGNFSAALESYFLAKEWLQDSEYKDPAFEAIILHNIGVAYNKQRQFYWGTSHLKKAINLTTDIDAAYLLPTLYQHYASALVDMGDTTGLDTLRKALQIGSDETILNDLGQSFQEFKQYDSALYYQQYLIDAFTKIGDYTKEDSSWGAILHNNLGLTFTKTKQRAKAIQAFQKAQNYARKDTNLLSTIENNKGFVYFRLDKNYEKSLESFQKVLKYLIPSYKHEQILSIPDLHLLTNREHLIALKGKGINLFRLGVSLFRVGIAKNNLAYLKASLASFERAHQLIKKMRLNHTSEKDKAVLAKDTPPIYEEGISVANYLYRMTGEKKYLEAAFEFIQANKSISLFEQQQDRHIKKISGIPKQVLEEKKRIIKALNNIQTRLPIASPSKKIELQNQEFEYLKAYEAFRKELEKKYPVYHTLRYGAKIPSIKDVQNKLLTRNRAIVEYFVGDTSMFILTITKNDVQLLQYTKEASVLENQVISLRNCIKNYNPTDNTFKIIAHDLYKQLLSPVEPYIKNKEIIIMPDGKLHYLPFEVLLTESSSEKKPFLLPFFIKRKRPISYARSTTLEYYKKQRRKKVDKSILWVAPEFRNQPSQSSNSNVKMNSSKKSTGALKKTKLSISALAKQWGEDVLLGSEAEKTSFIKMAGNYDILVLGTHGIVNDRYPMRSALSFTEVPGDKDQSQSQLYTSEIYGLELNAQLAFLMACETGTGYLQRGEGVISLGRAFSVAGCPSVVLSLWKIPERPSNFILENFFKEKAKGYSKSEALHRAKKSVFDPQNKREGFDTPRSWAGLVLVGEPEWQEEVASSNWKSITVFFSILLLILGFSWKKMKSPRKS